MSTKKGQTTRKRPQKYQNTSVYKNDLHDKTVQTKFINSLQISDVCERCKSILEWKIKYKKYKPLKAPKTCTKCDQKTIKHAYHMMCKPCARNEDVCPKCGKNEELVLSKPTPEEEMKLDQEMQAVLKSLPERKRRTFLRFMERNKPGADSKRKKKLQKETDVDAPVKENQDHTETADESEEEHYISRDDIMAKLNALKLSVKPDDDFSDFDIDSEDFDEDSDELKED